VITNQNDNQEVLEMRQTSTEKYNMKEKSRKQTGVAALRCCMTFERKTKSGKQVIAHRCKVVPVQPALQ